MFLNKKSVRSLLQEAETALQCGDINRALYLVHNFVEGIITDPVCTAQVFASRELDQLCLRIGRHHLADLAKTQNYVQPILTQDKPVLYLVSRLQRSGGHSRLVQDFIRAQPNKNHLILSTEVGGPSDHVFFSGRFGRDENVRFIRSPAGNFKKRLNWLQATLLASQPEHVYLFNHHQDSVAVASLVPELEIDGSFCHHGDHHLCLGVHMNHLLHIDFHPMGFHYCQNELGLENQYLPLTFEDQSEAEAPIPITKRGTGLMTATAARYNKIEHPYYVSYMDLVPEILSITKGQHLHIGKLSPWALRRLRANLASKGVDSERFIYLEWTSSVWKTLQANHVDLYIASFPYGAALTLIEAMGAGLPVILHQHLYSRVLSCLELAYPEAFSWADPEELLKHLATLTPAKLKQEGRLARQRYERYHRPEILKSFLAGSQQSNPDIPPLRIDFQPRWDEWAAWVDSQISWSNILRVCAIRNLRKARNFISSWRLQLKS